MDDRFANRVMPVMAIVVLQALMGGVVKAQSGGGTQPPNILVVVADDLGTDMVGAYGLGTDLPPTPNIDQLAADGLLFREAWSNPFCSPTRATIQTGRHSFRTGIGFWLNPQNPNEFGLPLAEITLPEMLDQGTGGLYAHAAIGKWHLGSDTLGGADAPNLAGYGHFAGTLSSLSSYSNWPKTINGVTSVESQYPATDKVDDAIAWLSGVSGPWFLYLAFNLAHIPFHAPPPSLHTVDLSQAGTPAEDPRPYYKAMVQALDTELGRLLTALEPQRDNTVVIFLGDNGTTAVVTQPPFDPGHGKGTLFNGGVQVPLIVRGPGVAVWSESDALVHTADVFATVAELAGVDLSSQFPETVLDSVSWVPYFADPTLASLRSTNIAELFLPNGPTAGLPIPPPAPFVCQPDVGFGGPGLVALSICGGVLAKGLTADLQVSGAPANSSAFLAYGTNFDPTPVAGGMLTPVPWAGVLALTTDAQGQINIPGLTSSFDRPVDLYVQVAVFDPFQTGSYSFSDTVKAEYLPPHRKAIRSQQYKLITNYYGAANQFYDLAVDPHEQNNLLAPGPLTPDQQSVYLSLHQALDDLLATP